MTREELIEYLVDESNKSREYLEKCNSFKLVNLWLHCNNIFGYTSDIIDVVEVSYNIKINENGET